MALGGVEAFLRLVGYGYPTTFFLRTKIQGREFYVSNDSFGYRFFPRALARTPLSQRMSVEKAPNTFRIFVFGESAAQGDPDPSYGAGRYLQALLRERFSGTDFEVVCAAMTAINSHAIVPIARECAQRQGDLWVIYMGNNEMVGPFGASTVFGRRAPELPLVRAGLVAKSTRTGQLLDDLTRRLRNDSPAPRIWSGLNMFKEHPLAYEDAARLRSYRNFQKNLADILRAARKARVPVILCSVGSNLKDCAPFASLHSPALSGTKKSDWDRCFQAGIALQEAGKYQAALEQFAGASAIDAQYAELLFRKGSCELALTNASLARQDFQLARDYDALDFRADARINELIKEAADAQAAKSVYFFDTVGMLAQHSPEGVAGNELFYDHVHFNFAGNYLLGRAWAEQAARLLPESIRMGARKDWASSETCDRLLAVSPWDRYRVWMANFSRVTEPPFTEQLNAVPRNQFYISKLNELRGQLNEESLNLSRACYQDALAARPTDYFLRGNFAQFLAENGDFEGGISQEQQVGELLPQNPAAPYKKGLMFVREGKIEEAAKSFSQVLAIRKDFHRALTELGLIFANQQNWTQAAHYFTQAIRINPGDVDTYVDWGFMEQRRGNISQTAAHYQQAAQLQPAGPATYLYQAFLATQAHQSKDAFNNFQGALWMNPDLWQARYLFGMELVANDNLQEARTQFSQVVRLRPDFDLGHLIYGVCLAKEGQVQQAQEEFQTTLRLNPTNQIAQQNLEVLKAGVQAHP